MKVTLVGHACWALDTVAGTVLTDPVFFDPFEQGVVVSCPKREVDIDALPDLAAIYLSHRHIDHFDFASLDLLDRDLPVFLPADPLMEAGLRELGFTDLRPLAPFEVQTLDGLEILPVPSYSDEIDEFGAVFKDASGSFYDQVDCPLTPEAMDRIKAWAGRLDVHSAMYASQDFGFFESRQSDTSAIYANNVYNAWYLDARLIVPGSAGFRFADDVGWLNPHLFPIASERFRADVERLGPTGGTRDLLPGDVIAIDAGTVEVHEAASDFARCVQDDTDLLRYDPSAPVPPLIDDNASGYEPDFLQQVGRGLVDNAFRAYLGQVQPGQDPVVDTYLEHGIRYVLGVVYPDGSEDTWAFDFGRDGRIEIHAGEADGRVRHRIAASALADIASGRKSAFWSRTRARRSSMVVALGLEGDKLHFDDVRPRDLLMHLLVNLRSRQVGEQRALREYLGLYPPEHLIRAEADQT